MTDQELAAGTEVAGGRYRIVEVIGAGNMGRVYRAYDHHLETDVVLKFPLPPGADLRGTDLLDRFARELRSLVALGHPHIVRIIDAGDLGGNPYVALQYLAGGTLRDRLYVGAGGMPASTLHAWLPEVARALDFVHGQGYIHRDVKPANILFDAHGNPFLGDFGIIKALASGEDPGASGSSLTAPGFLMGTPSYVAPEIVMGGVGDGRSDQYSLALTVHEVLTGQNVMAGPSPSATLVNQTKVEPPALADLHPSIPRRLSDAILRALSKDPEGRFPTCAALAREVLAEIPVEGAWPRGPEATSFAAADSSAMTRPSPVPAPVPVPATTAAGRPAAPRRLAVLGLALAALAALGAAAAWGLGLWPRGGREGGAHRVAARPPAVAEEPPTTVNIAYGTEKKNWLEAALAEFRATPAGRRVDIRLVPKGSVEGAQAVLDGPGPVPIHVWSPASSAYRDVFEREWARRHGGSPILRASDLALTPMVFVMWRRRHEAFAEKYGDVTFRTIDEAMRAPRGWESIAGRPEWGLSFKFGHTDPNQSNSGLVTLVLLAYDRAGKHRGLGLADVERPEFRDWLAAFERGVSGHGGSLSRSTGTLMEEMVKRGPSEYDCLMVYENLAIDFMQAARDRWGDQGELRVVYPDPNIWNENPYYILDVPWSGPEERAAASEFLEFLMSEPIQRLALERGFRPGNPAVGVSFPDSPLVRAAPFGVRIEVPRMCEPPRAGVVKALLEFAAGLDR